MKVEGDLDTMVLMGKNTDDRAGFQEIRVVVDVDADMSREEKEKFVQDVELRCPVTDNIKHGSSVHFVVA